MSTLSPDSRRRVRRLCLDAFFVCVALMLSYLESFLPVLPLPGFKLGFANIVIMVVFFYLSPIDAAIVSGVRVLLSAILFANPVSFFFSVMGALAAFLGLLAARFLFSKRISFIGVSMLCAALHNFGQTLAASLLFGFSVMVSYLPLLWIASVIFGAITGLFVNYFMPKLLRLNLPKGERL